MADLTIAQLTELLAPAVDNLDLLPIWDDSASETKKITINNFRTAVGVTNWSETFSSATQATSRWLPNNAAANVNAAVVPKGTGALLAQIPDGTATGGNARGTYAVDLQRTRTNAIETAGATYSFIGGGSSNRALGNYSIIVGGSSNQIFDSNNPTSVSGPYNTAIVGGNNNRINATSFPNRSAYAFIGAGNGNYIWDTEAAFIGAGTNNLIQYCTNSVISGGSGNTITTSAGVSTHVIGGGQGNTCNAAGAANFIGGGISNTASGTYATIAGGYANTVSASMGIVTGGLYGVSSLYGQQVHASGRFSANGDAQAHELIWRKEKIGIGYTILALDGGSTQAILPPTNCLWNGIISIAAICTDAGNGTTIVGHAHTENYTVNVKRIGTTTSGVGGSDTTLLSTNSDASMNDGFFTIGGNDAFESLYITYNTPSTAGSTTKIRIVATFRGLQIQF